MKANEAPEKIYVKITHPISDEYTEMIAFEDGAGIEYIRTDAFIEKVCEWIKENCKDYIIVDIDDKYEGIDGLFLEDFRTYMKGE